jgi:hypothetical protein
LFAARFRAEEQHMTRRALENPARVTVVSKLAMQRETVDA